MTVCGTAGNMLQSTSRRKYVAEFVKRETNFKKIKPRPVFVKLELHCQGTGTGYSAKTHTEIGGNR